MKKLVFLTVALAAAAIANAQDIEGKWKTIDDKTGKPRVIVQIYQTGNTYSGKIVQTVGDTPATCNDCSGPAKGKPLVGQVILHGLQSQGGGKYDNGKLFDPQSGRTYSGKAEVINGGNSLKLRGYWGVSALGRTQTWQRVN